MRDARYSSEIVTYLIANYNQAPFVADCLQSLSAQTDPHWVALVVDDASTDGSRDRILSLIDDRIRVRWNDRNIGYIATLECLIAEAESDIVAILDPDDSLEPEATSELREAHNRNPGAGLIYSRFAVYDESLTRRLGVYGGPLPPGGTAIIDGPIGAIRSFRRSLYLRTSGLNREMLYAEDRDLVYKLEELAAPAFIDAVLYRYRTVAASHARDASKRELGARNTRRARLAAIERRRLRGIRHFVATCAITCDYAAFSHRFPRPVRAFASAIASIAAASWRARNAKHSWRA